MDKLSNLIEQIESEIEMKYIGGAIEWADSEFNNAWSKAMDRFQDALNEAVIHDDFEKYQKSIMIEAENYKKTCLALIAKYREERNKLAVRDLFEGLAKK